MILKNNHLAPFPHSIFSLTLVLNLKLYVFKYTGISDHSVCVWSPPTPGTSLRMNMVKGFLRLDDNWFPSSLGRRGTMITGFPYVTPFFGPKGVGLKKNATFHKERSI